ncbi:phosphohexomutase domain-containing protein [Thermofilum pendens]|uniref:Phosphoglucomutase/phosphomannomutase alpha/beta/alpha domain I n=1 Tax=Thermofilum pendens (strain DSM 2475 / Hrk 5) TaxID=368408 RepID=A1RYE7_THEPD|nr:phosphoglucomutase/phosphomannomutase alpha/beta/subunit [Thermofilum pendens]ABL78227.1 phosphoglucomutase/phosphomannomutase alpha/beta/alpha domain I [Thermofilum pendens Hrk 5]
MKRGPFPIYNNRIYGVANTQLTPENMAELGAVLGTILGEGALVVAARDLYPPSRMLKRAFTSGLMSTGNSVIDFHAATLPELAFAVKRFGAKAGVHFSVAPYNTDGIQVKIVDAGGVELSYEKLADILDMYETKHIVRSIPSRIGWISYAEYIHDIYVTSAASFIDTSPIAAKEPLVIVDVNYGPASDVLPNFVGSLGARLVAVKAGRPPPGVRPQQLPSPRDIAMLQDITRASSPAFAAALSADASQVFIVDDKGRIVDPDKLVAAVALMLPEGARIAVSDSAGRIVDVAAEKNKLYLLRVKGLAGDVARGVKKIKAGIAATDSGEFIFPQFSYSPDGMLFIGKLLELLSTQEVRLSTIIETLPEMREYTLEIDLEEQRSRRVLEYIFSLFSEFALSPLSIKYRADGVWVKLTYDYEREKLLVSGDAENKHAIEAVKKEFERLNELVSSLS